MDASCVKEQPESIAMDSGCSLIAGPRSTSVGPTYHWSAATAHARCWMGSHEC